MRITGNVFNLLVMVNCAANFILYSALSTKFRSTFSHLFCQPCRSGSPPPPLPDRAAAAAAASVGGVRCCRCWPVRTYSSTAAAGRGVNPDAGSVYASVPAAGGGGGRRAATGAGRGRLTVITEGNDDDDDDDDVGQEAEKDDGRCYMTHTATTDKLVMSSPSAVDEDLDDLHVTHL